MERRNKYIAGAALAGALVVGGATYAVAGDGPGGEDDEAPITGEALDRASAAALAHVDQEGARVTETETGDEESYYEVEVTLENGDQIDVQLDGDFEVVGDETDDAGEDDD